MKKITILLLAAGQSKRLGQNKLLVAIEGQPLVRRTALRALQAQIGDVVVVTGHAAAATQAVLGDLSLLMVHNPDYASGLLSSLQAGLHFITDSAELGDSDAVMVVLADQVFLNPVYLRNLAEYANTFSEPVLIAPIMDGQRNHPVLIDRSFFGEILQRCEQFEKGAQFLFQRYPHAVRTLQFARGREVEDLDTPEDMARILALLQTPQMPPLAEFGTLESQGAP